MHMCSCMLPRWLHWLDTLLVAHRVKDQSHTHTKGTKAPRLAGFVCLPYARELQTNGTIDAYMSPSSAVCLYPPVVTMAAVNWLVKPHLRSVPSSTHTASQPCYWSGKSKPCHLQLSFHRCYQSNKHWAGPKRTSDVHHVK